MIDLVGNVVVVDDVITAGTAIREAVHIIASAGARLNGVLIALDRQEKGLDCIHFRQGYRPISYPAD